MIRSNYGGNSQRLLAAECAQSKRRLKGDRDSCCRLQFSSQTACQPRAIHRVVCKCGLLGIKPTRIRRFLLASAASSPVAVEPAFFRCGRHSGDSEEVVALTRADSGDGAGIYLPGSLVRVASPHQFGRATDPPGSVAQRSGFAKPGCDLQRLVVRPKPRCSLRPHSPVDVESPPAAFDMLRNLQPARRNMRWPFPSRNESAPELLLEVRQNKSL